MKCSFRFKDSNGITLIALVITILVLIILAGMSISLLVGNNSIIKKSQSAKIETDIAEEKEILANSVSQLKIEKPFQSIEENELSDALNQNSGEKNKVSIIVSNPNNTYIVQFSKSKRYYKIEGENIEEFEVDEWATVKLVNKNVSGNVVKEFTEFEMKIPIISNSYSVVPPKIEGYEPEAEVISDSSRIVTESNGTKTIIIEYYKILTD